MSWSGFEMRVGDVVGLGVLLAESLEAGEALWVGLESCSAEDSPQPTNSPPMINAAAPAAAARASPAERVFAEFSSSRFMITPIDSVGRLMRLPRSKPLSKRESSTWANLWITPALPWTMEDDTGWSFAAQRDGHLQRALDRDLRRAMRYPRVPTDRAAPHWTRAHSRIRD